VQCTCRLASRPTEHVADSSGLCAIGSGRCNRLAADTTALYRRVHRVEQIVIESEWSKVVWQTATSHRANVLMSGACQMPPDTVKPVGHTGPQTAGYLCSGTTWLTRASHALKQDPVVTVSSNYWVQLTIPTHPISNVYMSTTDLQQINLRVTSKYRIESLIRN